MAAGLWGMGDFSGGMGVRRAGGTLTAALRFILLSHSASLSVLLAIACWRGDPFPRGALLAWGLAAGVAVGVSLAAFYIALSRGAMGAAAAVSGLLAAAIPAAVDIAAEGAPGWRRGMGFLVAGAAIWLIAGGTHTPENKTRSSIALATLAGAGFGCYFVALKFAGAGGLVWPMATARIGSLTTCSLLLAALCVSRMTGPAQVSGTRPSGIRLSGSTVRWAFAGALLDTTGNLMFLAATRAGRLDVAAVLGSLYPASTILLAAVMLRERPTCQQGWGMAVAVAAVAMIAW